MGFLPTTKKEIGSMDPKNLIIFGLAKTGKTTSLAQLPGCLILDLENGSNYIEGYTMKANSVQEIHKIAKALKEEEHNFKFVVLDTITALEELSLGLAKKLYQDTSMGKNYDGDNVLKLPNGAGHLYLRQAVQTVIGWFEELISLGKIQNLILVGHVKDKNMTEGGTELNVKTLDLGGNKFAV